MVVVLVDEGMMDWVTCQLRSDETNEANECMCDVKEGAELGEGLFTF